MTSDSEQGLHWTPRTILRLFLVIGGIGLIILGILGNDVINMVLGGLAAILGAGGLWYEYRN